MKRIMSFILALVMCISLLPAVSAADSNTPADGFYLAMENNAPAGDVISVTGNDPSGYFDIPYTSGSPFTLYYYNAEVDIISFDAGNRVMRDRSLLVCHHRCSRRLR